VTEPEPPSSQPESPIHPERRSFLKEVAAIAIGAVATLVPLVSGLFVFFDPLRRKSKAGEFVFVAPLSALPDNGTPRRFSVVAAKRDVWNQLPPAPIGAVYLRRVGKSVEAFNVVCPHAGCPVDFLPETNSYLCPCHSSTFGVDGRINDPKSPSRRALDKLKIEIRKGKDVWVKFQNFQPGEPDQIPI
jgi:menaquinol-cytochrome c reductase iron-sulfur subunit